MNLLLNIRAKYCFLRANGIYYNCQQKGVDRMAGNTTNISIRMDADLKAQADALFTELGEMYLEEKVKHWQKEENV